MSADAGPAAAVITSGRQVTPQRLRQLGIAVCLAAVAVLLVAVLRPEWLTSGDPYAVDPAAASQPPSLAHLCGTDQSGRDLCTRIIYGARPSLTIGVLATLIGLGVGVILGSLSGLGGRIVDWFTTRALEVLYAFPGILLALLVISLTGPGVVPTTIAVGLSTAPGYARMVRRQFLVVRHADYVEADLLLGRGPIHRFVRTILPNAIRPLLSLATLGIGQAVVWAAALSYLGLGEAPPSPEWGALLNAGGTYLPVGLWWMSVIPGTAIAAVALLGTIFGRLLDAQRRSAR